MIVVILLYILLLFLLSILNPTWYAIGYIVFVSSFLGIMPPDAYIYNGVDYCSLLLNLSCVLPLLKNYNKSSKIGKFVIICWLIFFIYGLIRPVILGYQGLMLSVKASKSFLTYAFAAYMIVCCKKINFKKLFSFLLFLSLYYSVLYIIAVIIPIGNILLGFEKTGYIQCLYDSFIYFSICYVCSVYFEGGVKKRIFYIGILIIGIFLGGYFSMFGCSIVVVVYSIYLKATARYSINARRFIGIILLFLLLCIVFAMFKFGYFNEIVSTQTAAIDSRGKNNLVREYLIAKEIYFGYGFISQNSSYIQGMMQDGNQYAQSLSFVDSGYIDLLGKFGIVGTLFFLMIPFIFIKKMKLREDNMFVVLLISFYAINATWAVLCYPMGVIIIGIIFGFLIKNIKSDRNEQIKKLVGSK